MGWVPKIEITAGLLAGRKLSQGSLQGLYDFPSASHTSSGNIMFAQRSDFANDNWEGSYGLSILDDLLNHAMATVEGGGTLGEWYLLAEIEVPNPEGAQYYKQSYVVECQDTSNCRFRENTVTSGGHTYTCKWFEGQWVFRVSRFQYDTPTSAYTRTDLSGNNNRGVGLGCRMIEESVSGAAYYAFSGQWIWNKIYLSFGNFTANSIDYYGVSMFGWRDAIPTQRIPQPNPDNRRGFGLIGCKMDYLNQIFGEFELPEEDDPNDDPNNPGDEEGGGDGEHNRPVEPIPIPDLPNPISGAVSGFITMYALNRQQMNWFADDLFATTVWEAIKLFFEDPMSFIVSCACVPFVPPVDGTFYPKFGVFTFPHAFSRVENQFVEIDCGTIHIEPYGNNCFDFSPYTKIQIFLPYIGYRELDVDEVMGKTIGVKYHCDCLSGDCVAFITTQVMGQGIGLPHTVVIAQHHGNCIVPIPFGSQGFDNFVSASISGTVNGVLGIAQGLSGDADMNSAINGLKSTTVGKILGIKPTVERGGSIGGSAGYQSIQYPYIVRTFPRQSLPSNYKDIMGYPSNIGGTLGSGFSGLAVVEDIQLNNIPALEEERAEIMELLRKGVLL